VRICSLQEEKTVLQPEPKEERDWKEKTGKEEKEEGVENFVGLKISGRGVLGEKM